MALANTINPFPFDSTSTDELLARRVGELFEDGNTGKLYRLVQAGGTIAIKQAVATALSSGVPTWVATTTTTANDHTVAGVAAAAAVANDYLFVQVSGHVTTISAAAVAAGAVVGTSTTAGKVDDATIGAGVGTIGVSLESAAGADEDLEVLLKGLI